MKFSEIFGKYVFKNKIYFCLKNKSNVLLNKRVIFVFNMIFNFDFIAQIINTDLYHFSYFFCSLILVSKK